MEQQIIAIISEIKDDAELALSLNEHSNIMEDGGLDSLQMITFILKVEEQFGIEIDFEQFDFTLVESVTTFCRYISDLKTISSV
ncbi:acyl carrier protein [Paenibacillus methanolicus]|uniref:Acyl carrier protein n=1 Tax=Paenibacillus methanolicus TaxID=582686 RepID=A0A5S5CBT0_9BACL|nr:acyl carrier protein [Paenibacillus methanolicus]TYP76814.1 acyl carrier protein [Paenibacillus methanolicus]